VKQVDKFWDALDKSTIMSGVLAVGFCGTACYLAATGQEIPEILGNATLLILGWFFGAKTTNAVNKAVAERKAVLGGRE